MHSQLILITHSIVNLLAAKNISLSIAESCTGGLICEWLTRVSGASKVFRGGIVAYSDKSKEELLGVDKQLIATHGSVSEEVAGAMAARVRIAFDSTFGMSTTGIAGPSGGSALVPVGTVFVGLASAEQSQVRRTLFTGVPRERVRELAALEALKWLEKELSS